MSEAPFKYDLFVVVAVPLFYSICFSFFCIFPFFLFLEYF